MAAGRSLEKPAGLITIFSIILGIVAVNTSLAEWYQDLHHLPFHFGVGDRMFEEPLIYWINEGLMVFFFLHVGLEIKSSLTSRDVKDEMLLSALCAMGGAAVPALIFAWINLGTHGSDGWPIPTATDIVLVLAVLSLLGDRIPLALREFLLFLAVFDDIFAIFIVAAVFGAEAHPPYILLTFLCIGVLTFLNRMNNQYLPCYVIIGLILWQATQHAGIHPTLTGIIIALAFPDRMREKKTQNLADGLKPWVYFFIVPLFAFFNAGINLNGIDASTVNNSVFFGVFFGLLIGKVVGISTAAFIATQTCLCKLPKAVSWRQIIGAGFLAGIGFTMSLFMSSLAFEQAAFLESTRVAVISASSLAGLIGFGILWHSSRITSTL